jgi:pSer/pThr/pTyr-binding forkhead associated (FHA) protein
MILYSIGRNPNNKYVIPQSDDPKNITSNYHADIYLRDDGSVCIVDHSSNGTTVNGKRIEKEFEVTINRGDKIVFSGVHQLVWDRVPVVTPPPPKWNIFSIGTAFNNRIQLSDPSNCVSRFHATLKIDPKGKLFINDHSSNGTFVNGNKIPANQDTPIRRKDKILFANTLPLDWNRISKPSPKLSHVLFPLAALAIIAMIIAIGLKKPFVQKKGIFSRTELRQGKILSSEDIFSKYKNSVVVVVHSFQIVVEMADNKVFPIEELTNINYPHIITGSAFFIDTDGFLATNRHITMPWEQILEEQKDSVRIAFIKHFGLGSYSDLVKNIKGVTRYIGIALNNTDIKLDMDQSDFIDCSIISKTTDDPDKDIGLIRTKNRSLPNTSIETINISGNKNDQPEALYKVGEKVYVLGYPFGLELFDATRSGTTNTMQVKLTCQEGTLNSEPDVYKFGISAQIAQGASGSPVFDDKGNLIGIVNSGFTSTQGLNYAILSRHLIDLYDNAHK